MSFKWKDFERVASALDAFPDEAEKRSVIGRAYYASYHRGRTFLRQRGLDPAGDGDFHKKTWDALKKLRGDAATAGGIGDNLRKYRNNADYDDSAGNTVQRAKLAIQWCADIERLLDSADTR